MSDIHDLHRAMRKVAGDWRERFDALRHNYRAYEDGVKRGVVSWGFPCNPRIIADWPSLFTPIERIVWDELKSEGLAFWPQFPVGRYMVDFADPVHQIALECDGAAFHDAEKDARRDLELDGMGWTTYRVAGRDCFGSEIVFRDCFGEEITMESLRHGARAES